MILVDRLRDLLSDGGFARVVTWFWVLSWAEHAISSYENALSQVLVAAGGVVLLVWEAFTDRTRAWTNMAVALLFGGATVLAAAEIPRESGYLVAWGSVIVVVSYGLRSGPLVLATGAAVWVGALAAAAGADPLSVLPGTAVQFFVVFLLQSLARTARDLRRTQDELARSAVDAERDRLAVEINTLVGLTLADVSHQVKEARAHFAHEETVRNHLSEVDELVGRGLQQLAQLSYEPVVDDLDAELRTAHTLCRRLGVEFVESVDDVDDSVAGTFALLLREAVTNMFKHADASRCTVVVRQEEDHALFSLTNDGVGNAASPSGRQGTGQNRMRSQVDSAGGSVEAGPLSDGRYRVVVRVPTPVRSTRGVREDSMERNSHG